MDSGTAQKNWELENNITTVDPSQDQIYYYDAQQDKENVALKPWKNELVLDTLFSLDTYSFYC